LEYLFRQGLKKPDIPRQRIVRLTPLHHTQEHSASLPPGVTSPGHFSVDLKSLWIYIQYRLFIQLCGYCSVFVHSWFWGLAKVRYPSHL